LSEYGDIPFSVTIEFARALLETGADPNMPRTVRRYTVWSSLTSRIEHNERQGKHPVGRPRRRSSALYPTARTRSFPLEPPCEDGFDEGSAETFADTRVLDMVSLFLEFGADIDASSTASRKNGTTVRDILQKRFPIDELSKHPHALDLYSSREKKDEIFQRRLAILKNWDQQYLSTSDQRKYGPALDLGELMIAPEKDEEAGLGAEILLLSFAYVQLKSELGWSKRTGRA
jgi:hypothetical protein